MTIKLVDQESLCYKKSAQEVNLNKTYTCQAKPVNKIQ